MFEKRKRGTCSISGDEESMHGHSHDFILRGGGFVFNKLEKTNIIVASLLTFRSLQLFVLVDMKICTRLLYISSSVVV